MAWFPLHFHCHRCPSGCAGCIGRAQTSLGVRTDKTCMCKGCAARLVLAIYKLLCNFCEQDNIACAVNLTCQTCLACRIYLSGTILDITLQNLSMYPVMYQAFSDIFRSHMWPGFGKRVGHHVSASMDCTGQKNSMLGFFSFFSPHLDRCKCSL